VDVRLQLERARSRLDLGTLWLIAQSAAAAGISWELVLQVPNHGRPFFAPIAAVIALGAARGRRGRQAIEMMTGVAVGILVGAGLVAVAGVGAWQLVVGTLVALLVTTAAGAGPMIRNQAAASTILVVALHAPGSNLALQRLVDALIGGGVAIVLARLLFPIDPLQLVRDEAASLRTRLADVLDEIAAALEAHDRARGEAALAQLDRLDERRLEDAVGLAREVVRAAPRRRPLRRRIEALGAAWRELEASVVDARAIATGALRILSAEPGAGDAGAAVRAAAEAVRTIDPVESRERGAAARDAARRLREQDGSLGAGVLAHGVAAVADHALRAADAREEDRRITKEQRERRHDLWRLRVHRARR
jgi:hypothetical protein